MVRLGGSPNASVPAVVTLLPDLRPADALPPEIAASGASDASPLAAAEYALPTPMPADARVEKLAARARAVPAPDGKELPVPEPAPCTPGAVRSAA
jgi:hypothetical protein